MIALALVLLAAARGHEAPAAPAEQLREVEEKRGRVEFFLRKVDDKKAEVLDVLEGIEREARAADAEAIVARKAAQASGARVDAAVMREQQVEETRRRLAAELGPRLLLRYRLRGTGYLAAMVASPDIGDYLWRRRMVDKVLAGDLEVARKLEETQVAATEAREALQADREAFAAAEATATARAAEARSKKDVQAAVLAALGKERAGYARTVAELEKARQHLLELMGKLPTPPTGVGGFGGRRGRLGLPVAGRIEVAFGKHYDRATGTVVLQKGIDIRAEAGKPVRAPHSAVVGFAGWFKGFGNLVVLDHGEGYYTLYAHLEELRVARNDKVEEGTELGTVGDTGSLKGPYLYFEIRSGSKALDPKGWLAK